MFRSLLPALLGIAVFCSATVYVAPAKAQLSQQTAQNLANRAVKKDCSKGFKWVCGDWVTPLLSLSGKSWVWGGDLIYQCAVVCINGYNRVCESKGSVSSTAQVKHQVFNCRK
jgi:hypothetical protein